MRNKLQRSIVVLAQPAEVQLSSLPDYVCKADELALDFEDGLYELVGHESDLTPEQCTAIEVLDHLLSSISGEANAALWTDEAVRSHQIWADIRDAAKLAAVAFGWSLENLPPSNAVYMPAKGMG